MGSLAAINLDDRSLEETGSEMRFKAFNASIQKGIRLVREEQSYYKRRSYAIFLNYEELELDLEKLKISLAMVKSYSSSVFGIFDYRELEDLIEFLEKEDRKRRKDNGHYRRKIQDRRRKAGC